MKKFAVIYRDNTTFARYIPGLVDRLKAVGCEVALKVFPVGTPESEIAKEPVPEGDINILCDRTFKKLKDLDLWITIDSALEDASHEALRKKGHNENIGEGAKEAFTRVVAELLANGAPRPTEITIACSNLHDHAYQSPLSEEEIANEMAGWLRELFPQAAVRVRFHADMPSATDAWLIADRHYVKISGLEWSARIRREIGLVIRLPLETAVDDLAKQGFITKPENLQEFFEKEVLRYFSIKK